MSSPSATLPSGTTTDPSTSVPTSLLINSAAPPGDAGPSVVTVTYQVGPTDTPQSSGGGSNIPIGAIVGGTLGGMAIVALVVFAWIWWGRAIKRSDRDKKRRSQRRASKMPPRPSMKHVSSSTGSSFLTRDGKTVSFEFVSPAGAVAGAAVPALSKHAPPPRHAPPTRVPPPARRTSASALPPGAAAPGATATATVLVTPPEEPQPPRVRSPERPEKSPYRPSRRREAALAVTHARTSSGGSYRPSPLSQGASFAASRDPSPGAQAQEFRGDPSQSSSAQSSAGPSSAAQSTSTQSTQSTSKTPSPTAPPTPPFLRKSPTSKTKTNPSLVALHAAATTPTPNLSLLTQADGRVNRLSALSVQPASPSEWEHEPMPPAHPAYQQQQQYQMQQYQLQHGLAPHQDEDEILWRGSRVEMTPSPEGDDDDRV